MLQQHATFVLATGGGLVTERSTFERLRVLPHGVDARRPEGVYSARDHARDLRPIAADARALDDLMAILSAYRNALERPSLKK